MDRPACHHAGFNSCLATLRRYLLPIKWTFTQQKRIGTFQVFCGAVCGEIMNLTKASRYSIILCYCINTLDAIYSKLNMAAAHIYVHWTHTLTMKREEIYRFFNQIRLLVVIIVSAARFCTVSHIFCCHFILSIDCGRGCVRENLKTIVSWLTLWPCDHPVWVDTKWAGNESKP